MTDTADADEVIHNALQQVATTAAHKVGSNAMVTDWVCSANVMMEDGTSIVLRFMPANQPPHVTLGHAAAFDAYIRAWIHMLQERQMGDG